MSRGENIANQIDAGQIYCTNIELEKMIKIVEFTSFEKREISLEEVLKTFIVALRRNGFQEKEERKSLPGVRNLKMLSQFY